MIATHYIVFFIGLAIHHAACLPFITRTEDKLVEKQCGNPADIVFILDSSSSIWEYDFYTQLSFVQDVVKGFHVSQEQTRIGVMTFSSKPHRVFHLNDVESEEEVSEAIERISQRIGGTYTAEALQFARTDMFSPNNGARPDTAQIAIVITDGQSYDQEYTVREAKKLQDAGVHVFAIGVGKNVDKQELEAIGSDPDDKFVFTVNSYDALQTIRNLLAMKACTVETPDPECGSQGPTDVIFAFGGKDAEDDEKRNRGIDFIKTLVDDMKIGEDAIKVGLVPKECQGIEGFDLNTFNDKKAIEEMVQESKSESSSTSTTLRFMREVSFKPNGGARKHAKKVGVIIIDGETDEKEIRKSIFEAKKMKDEHDAEIFAIGVGPNIDRKMLKLITEDDENVFMAGSYAEAEERKQEFLDQLCADL
ncbi:unnamed protein product [Owenia fusiformis]|uniref:VWFA domain-containing protein n=1 Tax=Owenia fusiformis TaxID=6347 RepID=A0A8S4PF78_OWEFU|nr:unnamed protein product [Owenia fusiformis]